MTIAVSLEPCGVVNGLHSEIKRENVPNNSDVVFFLLFTHLIFALTFVTISFFLSVKVTHSALTKWKEKQKFNRTMSHIQMQKVCQLFVFAVLIGVSMSRPNGSIENQVG